MEKQMIKAGKVTEDDMMGEDPGNLASSSKKPAEASPPLIDFPEREVLEAKLTETEEKLLRAEDKLLRAMAETSNIQRRADQQAAEMRKYAIAKLLEELLPVMDGLEQGQSLAVQEAEHSLVKDMRAGMQMILEMMKKVLEKFGVKEINPLNEIFDPKLHEVMLAQEKADVPPNTVITVMQKGYQLHDRVIRPARVIVSKATA
jgi:molecular chaperone GrpE